MSSDAGIRRSTCDRTRRPLRSRRGINAVAPDRLGSDTTAAAGKPDQTGGGVATTPAEAAAAAVALAVGAGDPSLTALRGVIGEVYVGEQNVRTAGHHQAATEARAAATAGRADTSHSAGRDRIGNRQVLDGCIPAEHHQPTYEVVTIESMPLAQDGDGAAALQHGQVVRTHEGDVIGELDRQRPRRGAGIGLVDCRGELRLGADAQDDASRGRRAETRIGGGWRTAGPSRKGECGGQCRPVGRSDGKQVSLADLIVLAGCVAVEKAARDAGVETQVPFTPGRVDTTQDLTDVEMFQWLKPVVDGFRNYVDDGFGEMAQRLAPEEMFLDKANLLTLTAPEWVVLTGGLRALNANHDGSNRGIFTDRVGVLTTDFFRNLTDTNLVWEKADSAGTSFALKDRESGQTKFQATRNDLVFGSNAQLRNIADAYAGSDGQSRFVADFVRVWDKVMMLDRFDVKSHRRYGPMAA